MTYVSRTQANSAFDSLSGNYLHSSLPFLIKMSCSFIIIIIMENLFNRFSCVASHMSNNFDVQLIRQRFSYRRVHDETQQYLWQKAIFNPLAYIFSFFSIFCLCLCLVSSPTKSFFCSSSLFHHIAFGLPSFLFGYDLFECILLASYSVS